MNRFAISNVPKIIVACASIAPVGARVVIIPACAIMVLATAGCGSADEQPANDHAAATYSQAIVCSVSTSIEDREVYVLSAMNHKLRYYPAFASAAGISSVSDCAGARTFAERYRWYRDLHPGFDIYEPHTPLPSIPPPPPDMEITSSTPKILNGTLPTAFGYPNAPIVHLEISLPELPGAAKDCGGTFIAKNWIATAAHCLGVVNPTGSLTNGEVTEANKLFGWNPLVKVAWADAFGDLVEVVPNKTSLFGAVLQVPDDLYAGSPTQMHTSDHDFALLYLNEHRWDPYLPNPDSGDPSTTGGAMRISSRPPSLLSSCSYATPSTCPTVSFAGFSDGLNGTPFESQTLSLGTAPVTSILSATSVPLPGNELVLAHLATTAALTCKGDSGGPAFGQVNTGQPSHAVPVLMGVDSSSNSAGMNCTVRGQISTFARVDTLVDASRPTSDFIDATMQNWYSNAFTCKRVTQITDPAVTDFVQCWGKSCKADGDCGPDAYCRRPPSAVAEDAPNRVCPICTKLNNTGLTGCDCVSGQCIPLNSPFH
jgi:hypothetical protein